MAVADSRCDGSSGEVLGVNSRLLHLDLGAADPFGNEVIEGGVSYRIRRVNTLNRRWGIGADIFGDRGSRIGIWGAGGSGDRAGGREVRARRTESKEIRTKRRTALETPGLQYLMTYAGRLQCWVRL